MYNKKTLNKTRSILLGLVFFILLLASVFFAVSFGAVDISVLDIYRIIKFKAFGLGDPQLLPAKNIVDIIWLIRLPRVILAGLVGSGLALAGLVMQAIVRNPLADPYILGVSSGASLGATLAILLGIGRSLGNNFIGLSAFIGGFIVSLLVIASANIKGRANSTKLLLSGMAFSTLASAFTSLIIYFAKDREGIMNVSFWLMGSLSAASWQLIKLLGPVILLTNIFFLSQARTLNLMLLGDDIAITLGKDLHKYRIAYLLIVSFNIGLIVYASGIIGFVGLIIPHLVRIFAGTDHGRISPIISLLGGIFLIWIDLISRILIKGTEIPVGILVSIIGGPVFIYLMIDKSYGFGG